MSKRITLEELTADEELLGPWYSGDPPAVDAHVATPKDAAAHCIQAVLNADAGAKGSIKILAKSAEEKRQIRCFLDAMLEQPKFKQMVRKLTPEQISLHGGLRIVIDLNEARLTKDVVATIALDASVGDPIGSVWLAVDGDTIESKEDAAVRCGYTPDQIPQLQFARWQTTAEAEVAAPPPWDDPEPGPPREVAADAVTNRVVDTDQIIEERLAKRAREVEAEERYRAAIEARRREEVAEKLVDHVRRYKQRGV